MQSWLEEIAREHEISKTTLKHVKNFLSGVFRLAAQRGYFDGANPVKLAEVPAFAPNGAETKPQGSHGTLGASRCDCCFHGAPLGRTEGTKVGILRARSGRGITRLAERHTICVALLGPSISQFWDHRLWPVIPQLAQRLDAHRKRCGNPAGGPIFANSVGHPLDLNACYQREMKDVLRRAGIFWHGWHGFRRGLASNLNRLGVDDSVIQRILRHSTVATTQNHYIKTASPDAIAAMKQFSEALLCSACAPDVDIKVKSSVQ